MGPYFRLSPWQRKGWPHPWRQGDGKCSILSEAQPMTPEQFLAQLQRREPAAAYLFLGPESYFRDACRLALVERVLPPEEREQGLVRHDLDEITLAEAIDDACAMSLFAPRRVIWVGAAEAVLPRGRAAAAAAEESDEESEAKTKGSEGAAMLANYLKNPSPGVVLVFESTRFELDGEDKAKYERIRKFFAPIGDSVEFPRLSPGDLRRLAQDLVKANRLAIGAPQLELLVDSVGGSASRLATEIEKLSLFAGPGQAVTTDDIARLVPHAQATTIFALVAALGRKDRRKALELLDLLIREGEYLPLVLSFLATQFRHALVAREAGLRGAGQVQGHFSRMGVPMWPSKAEQIMQTVTAFTDTQLRLALKRTAEADVKLRDTRPDDRVVMEQFVTALTA